MTKLDVSLNDLVLAVLVTISLIFCFITFKGASAESISKTKYQALEKNIITQYKAAKIRCASHVGREKTFCDTHAEITKNQSKADLDSSFPPNIQARKIEKSDQIIQDKTVKFDDFNYKSNPFNTLEFDNIYHVQA